MSLSANVEFLMRHDILTFLNFKFKLLALDLKMARQKIRNPFSYA